MNTEVLFKPEETEIRNLAHLMDAEGTTDIEPTHKEISDFLKSKGFEAVNIGVWYDSLQGTWRWNCDINTQ